MSSDLWTDTRDEMAERVRHDATWYEAQAARRSALGQTCRANEATASAITLRTLADQIAALREAVACYADQPHAAHDWDLLAYRHTCPGVPAAPQDTPDPHDGHPYAYVDDCPDCEAARWPSTPQP